jgi:hypothetical protein
MIAKIIIVIAPPTTNKLLKSGWKNESKISIPDGGVGGCCVEVRFKPTPGAKAVAAMVPHIVAINVVIMYRKSIKASILPSLLALAIEACGSGYSKEYKRWYDYPDQPHEDIAESFKPIAHRPLNPGRSHTHYPTDYYA